MGRPPGCNPCCSVPDTGACPIWPAAAAHWQVPGLAGITGSSGSFPCMSCSLYQSPSTMVFFVGSSSGGVKQCVWQTAQLITCQTQSAGLQSGPLWKLSVVSTGFAFTSSVQLLAAAGVVGASEPAANYTMSFSSFNPLGSNTLTLQATFGGCQTWPSQITITPAP